MLRILIYLTTYALSLLHAKPVTNHSPTNTLPVTTQQGCKYDGQFYSPGERFDEGNDGQGWCYGLYCSHDGTVVAWDNFNCGTSTSSMPDTTSHLTTPKRTTPKSTTPEATTPKTTRPETTIPQSTRPEATTPEATTPLTTFSPPTTTPRPLGCEYGGQFYSPGERFGEGNDGQGWCYGSYCTDDGYIVVWDNFNCHSTTSPMPNTTFHLTTPKTTRPETTTPNGQSTTSPMPDTTFHRTTPKTTRPETTTPNGQSTTFHMLNITVYFTTRKITTPSNTTPKNTILATTLLFSTVFSIFIALISAY